MEKEHEMIEKEKKDERYREILGDLTKEEKEKGWMKYLR